MTNDLLAVLGRDPEARARIVAALVNYEHCPDRRFTTVRDDVTGPIADALHSLLTVTLDKWRPLAANPRHGLGACLRAT